MTLLGCTVEVSKLLNSSGLVLDIAGAYMLFKFGLPAEISRSGAQYLELEQNDIDEAKKAQKYDRLGRFGLGLLVGGFVLQLASNFS